MKYAIDCHGKIFWGDMKDYFWLMDNVKDEDHLRRIINSKQIPLATQEQIEEHARSCGWKGNKNAK